MCILKVSLSHTIGIAFGNQSPCDQISDLLPLLGVTEQDLCVLCFLNYVLLFCFPSLSYSSLSLPL